MQHEYSVADLVKQSSPDQLASSDEFDKLFARLSTLRDDLARHERDVDNNEHLGPYSEQDWHQVVDLGCELLVNHPKNLRVAIWICEGVARTDGVIGLTTGFELLKELCSSCWDELMAGAEKTREDAIEARIRNIDWLFVKGLNRPIDEFAVVKSGFSKFRTLMRQQIDLGDLEAHTHTFEGQRFIEEASESGPGFYQDACIQIDRCIESLDSLLDTLAEKLSCADELAIDLNRVAVANRLGAYRATMSELLLLSQRGRDAISLNAISKIDVSHFRFEFIEPQLAISGSPRSSRDLDDTPFTTIISLCDIERPRHLSRLSREVHHVCLPFPEGTLASVDVLTKAVQMIVDSLANDETILVHCVDGISRAPTVVALYLVAREGLSWNVAVRRIRETQPTTAPSARLTNEEVRQEVVERVRRGIDR